MRVLAIPGSLRNDSYNAKLLYNSVELFPEDVVLDLWGGLIAAALLLAGAVWLRRRRETL